MARTGAAPPPPSDSLELRLGVFEYLDSMVDEYGHSLPTSALQTGQFWFRGRTVRLIEPFRAILKPAGWTTALSVTSNSGLDASGNYQDQLDAAGNLLFEFMRENQSGGAAYNRALIETMKEGFPLVLFFRMTANYLTPLYPYFIDSEFPKGVVLAPRNEWPPQISSEQDLRRYRERWAKERVHQEAFRITVLNAYAERCCICRINYRGLLDAAHIVEDSLLYGQPVVENGLALCKIHHAAYDGTMLGIDPDGVIHVRSDLLEASDGPMLRHGLQEFHGAPIGRPRDPSNCPAPERLAQRWNLFLVRQGQSVR